MLLTWTRLKSSTIQRSVRQRGQTFPASADETLQLQNKIQNWVYTGLATKSNLQEAKQLLLIFTRDNTIINDTVNVHGQDIVERSGSGRLYRRSCGPLRIRRHRKENRDHRINGKISNLAMSHVQGKRRQANKVLSAKKERLFGSVVNRDCKQSASSLS